MLDNQSACIGSVLNTGIYSELRYWIQYLQRKKVRSEHPYLQPASPELNLSFLTPH